MVCDAYVIIYVCMYGALPCSEDMRDFHDTTVQNMFEQQSHFFRNMPQMFQKIFRVLRI